MSTQNYSTKSDDISTSQIEMYSTNYNKPSIRRYITKIPGKEELRGKNPQMKMIGPEVEDAIGRKNYIHLSTRFELLRRGYMIKAEPRPDAKFNVKLFSKHDPEYKRWKEANTPIEMKYDIYGQLIKPHKGPKPTKYDLALDLHDPPKFYPDGTPKPPSYYVNEELPNYEYFLVPRRCKKGVVQYFRPQQKIPYSHQLPQQRQDKQIDKVQASINKLNINKNNDKNNKTSMNNGKRFKNKKPKPNNKKQEQQPKNPKTENKEPKEKGWSQKARREQKMKLEEFIWPQKESVKRSNKLSTPAVTEENKENQQLNVESEKC